MTSARSSFAQIALLATAAAGVCHAQAPAKLQFEAASVKPSPAPPAFKYEISDHRIDLGGMSLKSLVVIAFGMQDWQVTAPDWTTTTRVDIQATLPPGAMRAQIPQLVQTVLADRFGLVVHHETQEHQIFALIQSKTGAKLADAAIDNTDRTFLDGRAVLSKIDTLEGDGFYSISGKDGHQIFDAQRITMAALAETLAGRNYFDDPVIDMTGLKGYWRVRFEVPRNNARSRARLVSTGVPLPPDDPDGISLPGELRKLGLDLDHRKAPVDHLVVDHVEKQPTEN